MAYNRQWSIFFHQKKKKKGTTTTHWPQRNVKKPPAAGLGVHMKLTGRHNVVVRGGWNAAQRHKRCPPVECKKVHVPAAA
jgi:hypothetical protein